MSTPPRLRSPEARRAPARLRLQPWRRRPLFEALEERRLLATIVVNNPTDTPVTGKTDLREAIALAATPSFPGPDTITFDSSVFGTPQTITLDPTLGQLTLDSDVTIAGPSVGVTVARSTAVSTPTFRIMGINSGVTATLENLMLTGGNAVRGDTGFGGSGGAILNSGTLSLITCTLSGNTADSNGGGMSNSYNSSATLRDCTLSGDVAGFSGGGISNSYSGSLTVAGSTLSGNAAYSGGGIDNSGTLTLTNSTLAENSAAGDFGRGGGIYNSGTLTLTNSTLSGNLTTGRGGGIYDYLGIEGSPGTATLNNAIIGGNTLSDGVTPSDLAGHDVVSGSGHNLIGPGGPGGLSNGVNGNIVVTAVSDLHLGPLANNGGPTQTIALLAGSPAIHAGDPAFAPATDQRGFARNATTPDIGAYEVSHRIVVTTAADEDNGTADPSVGTGTSLREAINLANGAPGADTIVFDIPGAGLHTIRPASPLPTVFEAATIDGTTQPGFAGTPVIELDGTGAGASATGLVLASSNIVVHGLVINRFRGDGILVVGSNDAVMGNFIGTDATGTAALGNRVAGVRLVGTSNTVAGNVISGNIAEGIFIPVGGNQVLGNFIGTNAAGTPGLGNGLSGITVQASAGNTIVGNVLSGNGVGRFGGNGISITGSGAQDNLIQANIIGTDASGARLGNIGVGVQVTDGSNNTIGGTTSGAGNVIAFNAGDGVAVITGTGNAIRQNSIFANGQGITLTNGGNANQPAPTLTAADSFDGTTMVEGLLSGFAPNATYAVEFFASAPGDPTAPGQGHVFLGSRDFSTDGSGLATIAVTLPATVPVGQVITATATSVPGNNTSEFAAGVIVVNPFLVTNTKDSGIGSLRQAILNANAHPGADTIVFAIPGSGVQTIRPTSPLPTLIEAATIDGTTQPGFAGAPIIELDGAGAGAGVTGLTLAAGNIAVRGLVINRFGGDGILITGSNDAVSGNFIGTDATGTTSLGNVLDGIRLSNASSNRIIGNVVSGNGIDQDAAGIDLESNALNNTIAGNKIGTDVGGNRPLGNSLHGVFLGDGSSNNTIDGNVISGNGTLPVTAQTSFSVLSTAGGVGVYIYGANTSGNLVRNNEIGTSFGGDAALPNSVIGVLISLSSGNTVQGNLISGNGLVGLEIAGATGGTAQGPVRLAIAQGTSGTASGNLVQGNKIGTNLAGTAAIANGFDGILINNASNNTVGGTTAAASNLISGNGSVGIQIFGPLALGNVVEGNALGLDSAGRLTLPNPAGGIFLNTGPLANQVGGTAPEQANRGQSRPRLTISGFHQSHAGPKGPQSSSVGRRFRGRGSLRAAISHGRTH